VCSFLPLNPGQVYRAVQNSSGKEFAVKVLDKKHIVKENKVEQVKVERNVLNDLDHPLIIKLFCTFQDATCLCTESRVPPTHPRIAS
jgi:serine/threonine protein kinase